MNTARLFRLMLWVHWRSFLARVRGIQEQSRLLLFVLAAFVIGYLAVGYWLFHEGLQYLFDFPLVGTLLSQRILYLIFGFFFVMLVFSNLIIGYSTLFKSRETSWLLSLPVPHEQLYRWKFLESLVGLELGADFSQRANDGRLRPGPRCAGCFLCCRSRSRICRSSCIPALLGSWIIVFLVRILSRTWVKKAAADSRRGHLVAAAFAG